MTRNFLWVLFLAASGIQAGCINKGDTNIGRDDKESTDDDDALADDDETTAGEPPSDASAPARPPVMAEPEPQSDADEPEPLAGAEPEPQPDTGEPEPPVSPEPEPRPDTPTGNGGSGVGSGGATGAAGSAGSENGGSGGSDEPDVMPSACDGVATTPINDLSLAPLDITDTNAMSALSVDFDGEKFIVAWISGTSPVNFAAVGLDGTVDGPWELARGESEALDTADVRVISSPEHPGDQRTLVVWQDIATPGPTGTGVELYGNWVANDGAPELAAAFPIFVGSHLSVNPRLDAAWVDANGGMYGLGFAGNVVLLSEAGDTVTVDGGHNQFVAMTPRATDFVSLTSDGGEGRRLGRVEADSTTFASIADGLQTTASGCPDHMDPSSCSSRIVWSGDGSNEVWVVAGSQATLERFSAVDGSRVGTPITLGAESATSRVLDARYHDASDTVGVLFSQNAGTESVRIALRRGDFTVVADAGSLSRSNETNSGQLVWAGDALYAFWLARPSGGGARRVYMTQVLCQ